MYWSISGQPDNDHAAAFKRNKKHPKWGFSLKINYAESKRNEF